MFKTSFLVILSFLMAGVARASLSGSYTIDSTKSASSTNYRSFRAATLDLASGKRTDGGTANGPGVSGAVVFKVSKGIHNEHFKITKISGASATNTITFDGDTASNAIITYSSKKYDSCYTVMLTGGASYINFRNLTIRATGDSCGMPFHFLDSNATAGTRYITIKHCVIRIGTGGPGKQYITYNHRGITLDGYMKSYVTSGKQSDIIIDSNLVVNCYYPVYANGFLNANNITISNNRFIDFFWVGIYIYGWNSQIFIYNNILKGVEFSSSNYIVSYTMGIYELGCNISSGSSTIKNNRVSNVSEYGIYINSTSNPAGSHGIIQNNIVGRGFKTPYSDGIAIYGSNYWDILNNTVIMDTLTGPLTAALCINNTQTNIKSINVQNNHFLYLCPSGKGACVWANSASIFSALDYNNYYSLSKGMNYIFMGYKTYTPVTCKGALGFNSHSYSINPTFTSDSDLTPLNGGIKGNHITGDTMDIFGTLRKYKPDLGAIEVTKTYHSDIGVADITSPLSPLSKGSQDIKVILENFTADTVSNADLSYIVNGGSAVKVHWKGTLLPYDTTAYTFTGSYQYNFTANLNKLSVYTSSPNGGKDSNTFNDTFTTEVGIPMSGKYIINNTGGGATDFKSFKSAFHALEVCGVSGPVIMEVVSSAYNEQPDLNQVKGTSSINTINVESQALDSSKVKLTYTPGIHEGSYTILLYGVRHITFREITFLNGYNSNTLNPTVMEVANGSDSNSFISCVFTGSTGGGSYNSQIGIYMGAQTALYGGKSCNNYTVKKCHFTTLALGIDFQTAANDTIKGLTIDSCIFEKCDNGLYVNSLTNLVVSNNFFDGSISSYYYSYPVYIESIYNNAKIYKNKIENFKTGIGLALEFAYGTSSKPILVYDNIIAGATNSVSSIGVAFLSVQYINFYNNSVSIYSSDTSINSAAIFQYRYNLGYINLKNNIFASFGNGTTASRAARYDNSSGITADYNDYYAGKGASCLLSGSFFTSYVTLSKWRTSSSQDKNSLSVNPLFASDSNLHPSNKLLSNGATPLATVKDDIYGKARSPLNPSMGAIEFGNRMDAGIDSFTNASKSCPGIDSIIVSLHNFINDTLKLVKINFTVNGVKQATYSWSGILFPHASILVNLGGYNIKSGSSFKAWTSLPNNDIDTFNSNDTATKTISAFFVSSANTITGDSTSCAGSTKPYKLKGGSSYTWSITNGNIISGSGTDSIMVSWNIPGASTLNLLYKDIHGCSDSSFKNVTVFSRPSVSIIQQHDTLLATIAGSYQWLRNNALISGATSNDLIPSQNGSYSLILTDSNGCKDTSSAIKFLDSFLQGTVYQSNGHVLKNTKVYLLYLDLKDTTLLTRGTTTTDTGGRYSFICSDSVVYTLAYPDSATYPNEFPCYHDSAIDITYASPIRISPGSQVADIRTIKAKNPGGKGFIGGKVTICMMCKKAHGSPAAGLKIILTDSTGNPVKYTYTNSAGIFSFGALSLEKYRVWVDQAFINNAVSPIVRLTTAKPVRDSLNFILYPTYLSLDSSTTTGIEPLEKIPALSMYPNPADKEITIEIPDGSAGLIYLYELSGQLLLGQSFGKTGHVHISTAHFANGLYILKIVSRNTISENKLLIQH